MILTQIGGSISQSLTLSIQMKVLPVIGWGPMYQQSHEQQEITLTSNPPHLLKIYSPSAPNQLVFDAEQLQSPPFEAAVVGAGSPDVETTCVPQVGAVGVANTSPDSSVEIVITIGTYRRLRSAGSTVVFFPTAPSVEFEDGFATSPERTSIAGKTSDARSVALP